MSRKYPIIAVTGSSGAGTTSVRKTFESIFRLEGIEAALIEGDSFHRYERDEMHRLIEAYEQMGGQIISHFGPEANLFGELEALFGEYSRRGGGTARLYLHNEERAARFGQKAGTFTQWAALPEPTDLLFYEGLHGGIVTDRVDVARHVDLLIGVTPTVNLEWIQKIHRDMQARGYSIDVVTQTILRRMYDYVHYITPQFSRTHANFQRVPTVDTSNPFVVRDVPRQEESFVVIRMADAARLNAPYLLAMIEDSFLSRPDTIVVPGTKMEYAMQLILTPVIRELVAEGRKARGAPA
ncbi:MAG TPA: phosphoribulokinase [Burkholderiales bacterium]|nr:phosphoribulokinase [Burkholderiales bacterium]